MKARCTTARRTGGVLWAFLALAVLGSSAWAIDPGPKWAQGTYLNYDGHRIQFLWFMVGADMNDSDVEREVRQRMDRGPSHIANEQFWCDLSQNNDQQMVMVWNDDTAGKFNWVRVRWHTQYHNVLQYTNSGMTTWGELRYDEEHALRYNVGPNQLRLRFKNPPSGGDWDRDDVIYEFEVYDR